MMIAIGLGRVPQCFLNVINRRAPLVKLLIECIFLPFHRLKPFCAVVRCSIRSPITRCDWLVPDQGFAPWFPLERIRLITHTTTDGIIAVACAVLPLPSECRKEALAASRLVCPVQ